MTRIVHIVIGKANPQRANGVNKVAHELASEQIKAGHIVEIWGLTTTPSASAEARPYKLNLYKFFLSPFSIEKRLCADIKTLKPSDMVHFHGTLMPPFYTIARKLKKRGIPWVITSHSHLMKYSTQKKHVAKMIYLHLFERFILKNARNIHVITKQEGMEMPCFVTKEKMVCIPNGYAARIDAIRKTHRSEPVFLYIGRMAKQQKGLNTLIDAFAEYKKNGYAGRLMLAGEGPDLQSLQAMASVYQLHENIAFTGAVFGQEKQDLLQKADFFVCPSRWDVIPTAILEAAANGVALLVSQETGFAEFVIRHNCGYCVPAADQTALLQSMIQAHNARQNHKVEEMQRNAARMIEEDFDLKKIALRIYTELYGFSA